MRTPSSRSERALALLVLAACQPAATPEPAEEDEVPRGALQLRLPLLETGLFALVVGVDHDPVDHSGGPTAEALLCTAYDGRPFPACYDEHEGSDFMLEGDFDTMDAGSATVVAAAAGVVLEVEDGHYDRCHKTADGIDCDGYEMAANYVIVEHAGGWRTRYWHLMNGSVAVAPGDEVDCGAPLGRVGSSGYSSQPHLHFEVSDAEDQHLDPYAGAYSQPETWWVDQRLPTELPADRCDDAGATKQFP